MLKFTGQFKELKNHGFTFHKLFANNYKVYMKGGNDYDLCVWVAQGGYVEFGNLFSHSKKVLQHIIDNRDTIADNYFVIKINRKTGFFVPAKRFRKREHLFIKKRTEAAQDATDAAFFAACDKWNDKFHNWSEVFLSKELIAELLALYDRGWLDI